MLPVRDAQIRYNSYKSVFPPDCCEANCAICLNIVTAWSYKARFETPCKNHALKFPQRRQTILPISVTTEQIKQVSSLLFPHLIYLFKRSTEFIQFPREPKPPPELFRNGAATSLPISSKEAQRLFCEVRHQSAPNPSRFHFLVFPFKEKMTVLI